MRRLLVAVLVALPLRAAAAPVDFEYLYIEANEGSSSGGHVAVRFADRCYHFQHVGEGRIRLIRTPSQPFDHEYRVAGNRPIHSQRAALAPEPYEALRSTFEQHYRRQQLDFALLDSRRRDRDLLGDMADGAAHSPRVPGSAYFYADGDTPEHQEATTADNAGGEIARRLRDLHGADVLERRAGELQAAIAALDPDAIAGPEATDTRGFADRLRDLLAAMLAVDVLRGDLAPRAATIVHLDTETAPLAADEIAALRRARRQIADDLIPLFTSRRPDWGTPMLIGLARLDALDKSLRARRLIVLDVFREDAPVVTAAQVRRHRRPLAALLAERRDDLCAARTEFLGDRPYDEARLSELELAANLLAELRRATRDGGDLRTHVNSLLPEKSARQLSVPWPRLDTAALQRAAAAGRERAARYDSELTKRHPYHVIARNCVTEIFRLLDAATKERESGREDSLPPFIPFLSTRAARQRYAPVAQRRLPSYRETAMARMYASENDAIVYLRESNVLTSSLYEPESRDSTFLFFTAEAPLARPVYGAVNLVAAVATAVVGVATAPFDSGATLRAGARGALFSLPELAFVNIRKGSFPFAPSRWVDDGVESANSTTSAAELQR